MIIISELEKFILQHCLSLFFEFHNILHCNFLLYNVSITSFVG